MTDASRNRAFGPASQRWWGLGLLLCGGFALKFAPDELFAYLACPIKFFTGWPCLTCGSTRALRALVDLDLITAFTMNPLVTALTLAGVGYLGFGVLTRREPPDSERGWSRKVQAIGLLLIVCNWIYLLMVGR